MTNINIYDSTYKMVHNISYNTRDDMAEILEEAVIEYVKNHDLQKESKKDPLQSEELPESVSIPKKELMKGFPETTGVDTHTAIIKWLQAHYNHKVKDFAGFGTEDTIEVGCIEWEA